MLLPHALRAVQKSTESFPLSYITRVVNSSTASRTSDTYSFTNIGPSASDRWVLIVSVNFNLSGTTALVNSVTVGGASTTVNSVRLRGVSTDLGVCLTFAWVKFTSGATANIVVNYSQSITTESAIGVYNLNTNSTFTATRTDQVSTTTASSTLSTTLSSTKKACHVAAFFRINGTITAQSGGTLNSQVDIRSNEIFILRSIGDVTGSQSFSVTSSSSDAGAQLSHMEFELN